MKDPKGQTYLPLNRYTIRILKMNRRTHQTWYVVAASADSFPVAQNVLAGLTLDGYSGHVKDQDTGKHWTPTMGWLEGKDAGQ